LALRFEWDPDEARRNLRKHRLSFEEATTASSFPGRSYAGCRTTPG